MKLRDFVLNSKKYALRSNLFAWNRFEISLGFYEDQEGTLWFRDRENKRVRVGERLETWFVMDDEAIVYDISSFPDMIAIWQNNESRLGALTRAGALIYINCGWAVKLNGDDSVEKLFKVADDSTDIVIHGRKAHVSRPLDGSYLTYDEVYDCHGNLDKKETEKSLRQAKNRALYEKNRKTIEDAVEKEIAEAYSGMADIFMSLSYCPAAFDEVYEVAEALFREINSRFVECFDRVTTKYSSQILIRSLLRKELMIDPIVEINALDKPHILSPNDDFKVILSAYRKSSSAVVRIFDLITRDCDCWDDIKSIFLNEKVCSSVMRHYGTVDALKSRCSSCAEGAK